jgi:cephalosporin-C deacetylase-like acetyl esterase
MKPYSLADQLALWDVDRPPTRPEMLLDFIEGLAQNQPTPPEAQTWEELQARRAPLQKRLRHSLGLEPWPERASFKTRLVGTLERDGYRIEKLVYEAWAGLPVTAHLYIPHRLEAPVPGLVYACGHWMEAGKLAPTVQSFCASAATLGIAALVFDPIGQGERLGSWRDHGHLNALLVGKSQLGLMVWESIRALEVLLTRSEVNPHKVAITGASGGGLNTLFTAAIEDRFACAIPVAYPCTFFQAMRAERDLNWEDGDDVCNQVPQVMSYAEMSDIASLFIPRPYMILSGSRDKIFPIAGARQIAAVVARNYALAGVPEHFRFAEFDEEHGYQLSLREAAYAWLKHWLFDNEAGASAAAASIPEPQLELFPNPYPVEYSKPPIPAPGQVRLQSPTLVPVSGALPGFCLSPMEPVRSEAFFDSLFKTAAQEMPRLAPLPDQPGALPAWQREISLRMQATLGPFPERGPLHTRLFNQVWEDGLMAERVTFESEPGIILPGLFVMPAEWYNPAPFVIYAGEWGKQQGLRSGLVQELVDHGYGVLAIDVRGVGETATTDFEAATNLLMMDRPLFGQRVWDVLRGVDFIWERCYIAPQIDKGRLIVAGDGVGGLWALHAAALDGRVAAAVAGNTLYSYKALLDHGARYPASTYLFDVLNQFDLAHVVAACAPRPVYLQPVDGWRRPCRPSEITAALQPARQAFALAGASSNELYIPTPEMANSLPQWLDNVLDFNHWNNA